MRRIFILAAVTALAAGSALAATTPQQDMMKSCSAKWSARSAADKGATKRTAFMSSCMKAPAAGAAMMAMKPGAGGTMAMKPAAAGSMAMSAKPAGGSMAMKPAAATGGQAKCKDGVTVTYKSRMGTCSGHGGVVTWL